jgi:hypothetical protein
LFLISINCSAEEVFDSFIEFKPFDDGPWPCLNHASSHYTEPRVLCCKILDGEKKNKGKPIGTFSCSCGFIYTRTGPDLSEADRFRWTSVQDYGVNWENLLKRLWEETSLSLRQIAQELGVTELTVKRRAISLGLPFPRQTLGSQRSNGIILNRYKIRRISHQELLNRNREKLLSLLNDNPMARRTELKAIAPHLLDWLSRVDKAWLDTCLPSPSIKFSTKAMINWSEEDLMLSEAVKRTASQIQSSAYPKRVSITAITELVGHRAWIEKRIDKLPLTSKMLDTHLESFEDFLIRRIAWAAELFRKQGDTPSRAMLANHAGVRGRLISNTKRVQSALDSALGL